MTRSETILEIPEVIKRAPETIEPGSLEWYRAHAPFPLVLRAFFEDSGNRREFGRADLDAEAACEKESELIDLQTLSEILAESFEQHDDPNAKEIVRRLRILTGCKGRLRSVA